MIVQMPLVRIMQAATTTQHVSAIVVATQTMRADRIQVAIKMNIVKILGIIGEINQLRINHD